MTGWELAGFIGAVGADGVRRTGHPCAVIFWGPRGAGVCGGVVLWIQDGSGFAAMARGIRSSDPACQVKCAGGFEVIHLARHLSGRSGWIG